MAGESKQIYQLTNGTFNGSSLVPFEVPNTDTSTSAEKPYITRKTTGDEVSEFVAKTQEFETDLQTDDKTIIGAINELKEGGGGNANYVELTQAEYDELTEEEKHNGKMYFITDGGSDGSIIDDETTSAETTWSSQKIDGELTTKQDSIDEVKSLLASMMYKRGDSITKSANIQCAGRINNAGTQCLFTYPLNKVLADDITSATIVISGSPLAYVGSGNVAIQTGTYSGSITENGINFTVNLTSTSTSKGAIANAILANRTITFN